MTPNNVNSGSYAWQASGSIILPSQTTQTAIPVTFNLTGGNIWQVDLAVIIGGVTYRCVKFVIFPDDPPPPPPTGCCGFTAHTQINCSRLEVVLDDFDANCPGTHSWEINGVAWGDPMNPVTVGSSYPIFNINTYQTADITVSHRVEDGNGDLVCEAIQLIPTSNPTTMQGVFIGGAYLASGGFNLCTNTNLSDVVGTVLPLGRFPDAATPQNNRLYITGNINMNRNYLFQDAFVGVGSGTTMTLRRRLRLNGTYVGPSDDCTCLWQGMVVAQGGELHADADAAGFQLPNTISRAVYGFSIATTPGDKAVQRINNTRFDRNFIGFAVMEPHVLGAVPITYNLGEFDANVFIGGTMNSVCEEGCPLTTNLQGPEFPFLPMGSGGVVTQSYAGVFHNSIGTNFTVPTFLSRYAGVDNSFTNLAAGIVLRANTATIRRCYFADIERDAYGLVPNLQNYGYGIQYIDGFGANTRLLNAFNLAFHRVEHGIYAGTHKQNTRVNISGCTMTDVFRGITLVSPNSPLFATTGNIIDANISGNKIESTFYWANTGTVPDAVTGYYGIHITDFFPQNSTYYVRNNRILLNNPGAQGIMKGRGYGIYVQGIGRGFIDPTINTHIDQNNNITMLTGESAIELKSTWNASVRDNILDMNIGTASFPSFGKPIVHGIKAEGGGNHTLSCNKITRDPNMNPGINFHGIVTDNAPNLNYNFNTVRGAAPFAQDLAFSFRANCTGNVGCNEMHAPFFGGMYYHADLLNGGWTNGATTGEQDETGNKWFNNQGDFTWGAYYTDNQQAGSEKWVVNSTSGLFLAPPDAPNDIYPNIGWFNLDGFQNPSCTCDFLTGGGDDNVISPKDDQVMVKYVAREPLSQGDYSIVRHLYQKIEEEPSLLDHSAEVVEFYDAFSADAEGKLWQLQKESRALFEQNSADWQTIEQNNNLVATWEAELSSMEEAIALNPNQAQLAQEAETLRLKIAQTNEASLQLSEDLLKEREQAAQTLNANLAALTMESVFGEYEKNVFSIFLKWVGASDYSSFQDDLALLRPIAETCPKDGGDAVWLAQALYLNATNEIVEAENCASVQERGSTNKGTKMEVGIFPNPTTDMFTITSSEGIVGVEIYDFTGRILSSKNFTDSNVSTRLFSVKDLPTGMYNVKVINAKGEARAQSFVIID